MVNINQARLKSVLENMRKDNLPQILVSATASVYYLTGIWVQPMERMLALYIHEDGTCALFGNALFGLQAGGDVPLYVHSDMQDPLCDLVKVVRSGVLGVDKSWPSRHLLNLMRQRPDLSPVLGSAPVDTARMCKDAQEIAALRQASQINDQVMGTAIAAIAEGVTEAELETELMRQYQLRGATRPPEGLIVSYGAHCADPHHSPSNTLPQTGDSIVLDIYTPVQRYWCDMTRSVFFREAGKEEERVYHTVLQANQAAEAAIRPGMQMCEIDTIARQIIEEAGYGDFFTHRLGHGLGIDCHEPPDNSASDHTVVRPGMVFSVEPGIYLPGRMGVRIEDLVLVTEDGCEVLNQYPKDLRVVQ